MVDTKRTRSVFRPLVIGVRNGPEKGYFLHSLFPSFFGSFLPAHLRLALSDSEISD